MSTRRCLAGLVGFFVLAGVTSMRAADVPVAPESLSNTYLNIEGGYVNLDGEKVQAFLTGPDSDNLSERFFNTSDGYYGRVELGRMLDMGFFDGIGAYAQGWWSDKEDTSETDFGAGLAYKHNGNLRINTLGCSNDGQPCSQGRADLDRSLIETGLRFFHDFGGDTDPHGLSLGIEPFVAFIDEDTNSEIGFIEGGSFGATSDRSSDLNATAFGVLLALDAHHAILEQTVLIARVAAGAYYMDADADTHHAFIGSSSVSDDLSSDFVGFRGQLALGVEQMLTDTFSIGVIGRLDYWSDFPSMDWTDATGFPGNGSSNNSIAEEDFLALSIGVRLSLQLGI